jgi:hypothetical protein
MQGKGFEPAFTITTRVVNDCIPAENGELGMHLEIAPITNQGIGNAGVHRQAAQ